MVLVTGASGHIGNVLVRALLKRGEQVAIITSTGKTPDCLADCTELITHKADLRDANALNMALKGAQIVYHLAGIISISSFDSPELFEVNVQGTQNVIDACRLHGVKRLVYTSSVHALPEGENGEPITEEADFNAEKLFGAYARTKAEATKRVLHAVEQGLDAVICFPSGVVGPFDFRGSEAGRLVRDYATNKLPAYIDGEYNFVDVRDVVNGILLAAEKGKTGEGYILAGERMNLDTFFNILASFEPNMKKPSLKIPIPIATAAAWLTESTCRVFNIKPLFTVYAIKVLQSNCNISSLKAQRELGYTARPIRESIADALQWLKDNKRI